MSHADAYVKFTVSADERQLELDEIIKRVFQPAIFALLREATPGSLHIMITAEQNEPR